MVLSGYTKADSDEEPLSTVTAPKVTTDGDDAAEDEDSFAPSASAGNAVQSRVSGGPEPFSMQMLSDATARFWEGEVAVCRAKIEEYSYTHANTSRTTKFFKCILVSTSDPTQYCAAEVRNTKVVRETCSTMP